MRDFDDGLTGGTGTDGARDGREGRLEVATGLAGGGE
jgi:hypothetical protein